MREPTKEEELAFEAVSRVLGVEVVHRDDGRSDGQVDAHIEYASKTAALEVSMVGDQDVLQVESALLLKDLGVPALQWWWDVRYGPSIPNIKLFRQHVPTLLRGCEAQGVRDPIGLGPTSGEERKALDWYRQADVRISGLLKGRSPGLCQGIDWLLLSRRERDSRLNLPEGCTFDEKPVFGYERRFSRSCRSGAFSGWFAQSEQGNPRQGEGDEEESPGRFR